MKTTYGTKTDMIAKLEKAKKLLLADGWIKSHTVCHDGGATGNFGTCYIKDGKSIYLNIKTVNTYLELLKA